MRRSADGEAVRVLVHSHRIVPAEAISIREPKPNPISATDMASAAAGDRDCCLDAHPSRLGSDSVLAR